MRLLLLLFSAFLLALPIAQAQQAPTLYLFPGQGSDKRLFDSLHLDETFPVRHIEYGIPPQGSTMQQFAQQLIAQIDTSQAYVLIGVSMGGMLCAELSEVLNPEKVIIISSAKNRQELPFGYTFQRIIPLYKLMPPRLLLGGAKMLQPLVEPDRNKSKATFQQMLGAKDPLYMKRSIGMIIRWDRTLNSQKIIHIHGDNDHTLPIRRVRSDYVLPNGSHMITLTRFEEVKQILVKELQSFIISQ